MSTGLNDFLKHIKSNPQNDTLIDRFTALVGELEAKARQPYFEKLFTTLESANPHGALRAAYFNLQAARAEGTGTPREIEALQWVEKAFVKLGKESNASMVRDEIERVKKKLPPPIPDRRKKAKTGIAKAPEQKIDEVRFTHQRADFIASLYESFAQQLLEAIAAQLKLFKGKVKPEPVAQHLIQSFRHVYAEMKPTLRNSRAVFGHNPLLVTEQDKFREDLVQIFLSSPLFAGNKDRIAAQRIRLLVMLLTAWFDQYQHLPEGLIPADQERLQNKFLEMAVSSVLYFED